MGLKINLSNKVLQNKLSKLAGIVLYTFTKVEPGPTLDPKIETVKKLFATLAKIIDELLK